MGMTERLWDLRIATRRRIHSIHMDGDRSSKTVRLGRWLRSIGIMVTVGLWDGYRSTIYWRKNDGKT